MTPTPLAIHSLGMNLLQRWMASQNERHAIKQGMRALSKECMAAVQHSLPHAQRIHARALWYGDQTKAAVVWTDEHGQQRRWGIYLLFFRCRGAKEDRAAIIAQSLAQFLAPAAHEDNHGDMACRSAAEVAQRLLALAAVVSRAQMLAQGVQHPVIDQAWLQSHGIAGFFSASEAAFWQDPQPGRQALVDFSWRAEAMLPMVWALGGMPALPPSDERASIWAWPLLQQAIQSPAQFIVQACLRAEEVIANEEERLVDEHWQVTDARLHRKPMPAHLDSGIVLERRYALSWMIGYGEDWDCVPVDT